MKEKSFVLKPFSINMTLFDNLSLIGNISRQSNVLSIRYELHGRLSDVLIPDFQNTPCRKKNLWENTCFEYFVGRINLPEYWEFNLSPSGHWNVFRFQSYRNNKYNKVLIEEISFTSLPFRTEKQSDLYILEMECNLDKILDEKQPIEIAVSAVIRLSDENRSYWALTHCDSGPDFHNRKSFIIHL